VATLFTGVCDLDGLSQASMDGFLWRPVKGVAGTPLFLPEF